MAVLKVIELVGTATEGWEAAAHAALVEATRTLRQIESLEVLRWTATVRDARIVEYQALVRLVFRVEAPEERQLAVAEAETILAEPTEAPTAEALGMPLPTETRERPLGGQ